MKKKIKVKKETAAKLQKLFELHREFYKAFGDNAAVSAQFAVQDFMNTVKNQMQYIDQLLDEIIEDVEKGIADKNKNN